MRTLEEYRKAGISIYDRLHLQTYPVAIKYIRDLAEMPEGSLSSTWQSKSVICQIAVANDYICRHCRFVTGQVQKLALAMVLYI